MSGDYSRKTFSPKKHYSGVQMQQGRVQLDADWNEQLDIANHRTQTETIDVIGHTGVPKKDDGFKIGVSLDGHDLTIAKGRIYVEGLLCELEDDATYTNQPYLPNPDFTAPASPPSSPPKSGLDLNDGVYLVLLDAWQREITALDDPLIREVALGGPDTTTRLQNVWQVKLLEVGATSPPSVVTCDTSIPAFNKLTAPTTGTLNARTQPPKPEDNPCLLPPQTGYTRLENQLYRVEVQKGGPRNQVTFKWSRDNGSVETIIKNISNKVLTVAGTGKDETLSFAGGQWVEIVDDESTLKGTTPALMQIDKVDADTNKITLKTSAAAFANLKGKKLRRWDQSDKNNADANGVAATADWIDLENGIQIKFSDGEYHVGDYWLVPARTATGEIEWPPHDIPNQNPIPQPPRGIRHYFCRLALVRSQNGALTWIEDCRKRFPPLTGICAEDICFDNEECDFAGAENVQQALDMLCKSRDLRFHNKHLHGWGIVCGLQVECGLNTSVKVRPGYAITCEGDDVILDKLESVNLLDLQKPVPGSTQNVLADGEVCLILEPRVEGQGDRRFRLEPFKPSKSKLEGFLQGTIWKDVIDDCLKPLIDFAKGEFDTKPEEGKPLVGPAQKRLTTFTNLLIQLINKQNGSFVYLSGSEKAEESEKELRTEDAILRAFYNKLRALLQSRTFCAMFENARPFPDYPEVYAKLKIATIFGKGFQKRFRVSPNGLVGYSLGAGNKIHVFDLKKNEMVAELEFPGGPTAVVQDVAFSKDGKQLYAAATIQDKDGMFAVADVGADFKYKWRAPTMTCDIVFRSLGTIAGSKSVFATGKGKGLYELNPEQIGPTPTPRYQFNAVGHLEISEKGGFAVATASAAAGQTTYNRVLRLNLKALDPTPPEYKLVLGGVALSGEDDIAISSQADQRLYVVVNSPAGQSTKHVAIFDVDKPQTPIAVRDLKENTDIRLAYNPITNHTMVTFDDSYRVGLISPANQFVDNYRHPVQIAPGSIAIHTDSKRVYVLNYTSNTVSSIPAELFDPQKQIPLQPLVDYRAGVLNAFADLLAGLLQYLKDCFCDHLLINCPECDGTEKLYLACITIKNGKVFKVCNFSMRKYVHSFPTVEYWLSIVPIIPTIKMAFEKFCCSVLPGLFAKYTAPKPDPATGVSPTASNMLKSSQMRSGITFAQQADFKAAVAKVLPSSSSGRKLTMDTLTGSIGHMFTPARETAIHRGDIEDKPTDDVRKKLEQNRIVVDKVEAYDPNKAGRNLIRFTQTPSNLEPGTRVNLITKDDKVMFYTLADEEPPNVEELRTQFESTRIVATETKVALDRALPALEGLRNEVAASKTTFEESRAVFQNIAPRLDNLNKDLETSKAELAANKATLEKLSPQFEDLRSKVAADSAVLAENKARIEKALPRLEVLAATVDKSSPQIAELRTLLDAASAGLAENKSAVAEALTLRQELTSLRQELLQTRQAHQQEIAARDKDITELKTSLTSSRKLLDTISERVKKLPPG